MPVELWEVDDDDDDDVLDHMLDEFLDDGVAGQVTATSRC